ncbi:FAA hydrolase family protein [Egibacter rhizosphaerae]|uniref:FAA hydrolase family protein n=1 Tax=Egibacter rhizosphaerae TaxID=1670831 RepID=A0A411YBI3_9ACTN|nr:fumarylacetoacetate hydrolase family protein [Egibacter rhizosphaerae]QBI18559.1 FAA hydrolase family protein [Egibacter rhizosphaerae]
MRLVRHGEPGRERPGVLLDDDTIVDVGARLGDPGTALLTAGGLADVRALVESRADLPRLERSEARLGPPIPRPPKVIGIGLNYADHARESGMQTPPEPIAFGKAPNALTGPTDVVWLPPDSDRCDWEVELGVVIGQHARRLPDEAAAYEAIAGWCISNDLTERAHQFEHGGQWIKGKSHETFNPLGPWLVTKEELRGDLRLTTRVSGDLVQDGTTADMIFPPTELVRYLSWFMTLEPGDLVSTGTPAGVGMGQNPPRFLRDGDVLETAITGLGEQRNLCHEIQLPAGETNPLQQPATTR